MVIALLKTLTSKDFRQKYDETLTQHNRPGQNLSKRGTHTTWQVSRKDRRSDLCVMTLELCQVVTPK
jgi:hypothetical protein